MSVDEPDDGDDLEFDEESEEQWLADWDEADRQAVEVLRGALPRHRGQPAPADPLAAAAATVRARLREGGHPLDWVAQAAGLPAQPAPEADAELLIRLTAATISPQEETGLEVEEESMLMSLEHADWLGAIITAVRNGPGSDASPEALAAGVGTCPELELESELDVDDESQLETAFWIVALPWEVLGLTDRDQRLTQLGEWVLPRALARAWSGDFDDGATTSTS
ncbi:MAG: hypothetical protein ACRDMX_07305 [Solirubrobacteraceae bacterium]